LATVQLNLKDILFVTETAHHETIDAYTRSRQIELARTIEGRAKVYLDVNFWIIARDAAAGTDACKAAPELLDLLRRGVAEGTLVCPISESTFIELMKQPNTPTRRIATARLIDELSLGVSLTTSHARIATEIAHFFCSRTGQQNFYAMQELVWTKLSYTLGYIHPSLPGRLDRATELALQKGFFDEMWKKSLLEILEVIGDADLPVRDELRRSASGIDADIKVHMHTLKSYQQTYKDEIVGTVDVYSDLAADVMGGMAERDGVTPAERGSPSWIECQRMCRNLLIAAFQKPGTKEALRTIHALASLHACLRRNKMTNFKENHFYDFEHAAAALAYCDAFLTEGFLTSLANARHTGLCGINDCRVTADVDEAVTIVREFVAHLSG
jgi:hypothetical protein